MKAKGKRKLQRPKSDLTVKGPSRFFRGVNAIFTVWGISKKRLQVWQSRFEDLGGTILTSGTYPREKVEHIYVLAAHQNAISKEVNVEKIGRSERLKFVGYKWVEECLKNGELLSCDSYCLRKAEDQLSPSNEERQQPQQEPLSIQSPAAPTSSVNYFAEDLSTSTEVLFEEQRNKATEAVCTNEELPDGLLEDDTPDFNKHVSGILLQMSEIYADVFADEWRALTYRKVANTLQRLPYKISSADELKNVQGIGKSMIVKIKEIMCTGQLQKLVNLKANYQVQTMQQFASVWGIGRKHARRLYQAGHKTLQDISEDPTLPSMARVGLKYHQDIIQRISRSEVTEAGAFVQKVVEDLCPGAWMTIGGSYRRGQETCGDIDLLITHQDGHSHIGLMGRLVVKLQEMEFLSTSLIPSTENSAHKVETFMGICKLPQYPHHRRIDIKIYPKQVYAFALVYFTGNDVLNRRIRYLARTKGYKLSDQGLFLRIGNQKDGKTSEVTITCETEEDIFDKLGVPYPAPQDRNW